MIRRALDVVRLRGKACAELAAPGGRLVARTSTPSLQSVFSGSLVSGGGSVGRRFASGGRGGGGGGDDDGDDTVVVVPEASDEWRLPPEARQVQRQEQSREERSAIHGYDEWGFQSVEQISVRNTAAVMSVKPRVDLLLVGTGEYLEPIDPVLASTFARRGISVEAMATRHAIATFNVLNETGRNVAAALLSKGPVSKDEAYFYDF